VNEIRHTKGVGEQSLLQIEMQSGDLIEIQAAHFAAEDEKGSYR
jgi:hypothetical protein